MLNLTNRLLSAIVFNQVSRQCNHCLHRLTFVMPLTMASNDSRTKPNVVRSKSTSSMKPPGLECVCVLLIITFLSVYKSPNWICNLRNTCEGKKSRLVSRDNVCFATKTHAQCKIHIAALIHTMRGEQSLIFALYNMRR